jgi:acyl-coenzyme A thioesterase PaaI-like protein
MTVHRRWRRSRVDVHSALVSDFNAALGLRPTDDGAGVLLDTRPEHEAAPGTIHLAVLATVAEVAAAWAVGGAVLPIEVHLQLLRRAAPGQLVGRGRVLRRGGRLAFAEGEVFQGDTLVAKAAVTFTLPGPPGSSG